MQTNNCGKGSMLIVCFGNQYIILPANTSHLNIDIQLTVLSVSGFAGSAGCVHSTERVSAVTIPQGIPPSLARPHTTVIAQLLRVSMKVSLSKKPHSQTWPPGVESERTQRVKNRGAVTFKKTYNNMLHLH